MIPPTYDIIICGAGPAGSTCALALEGSGLSVVLIDKASFPRDKVCGDAIAPYVPNVLGTINPQLQKDFEAFSDKYPIHTLRVVAPNKKILDLGFQDGGAICMRQHLDNFLFQKAQALDNVTVLQNSPLYDIQIENNEVTVFTKNNAPIRGKIVIGCDGAQGVSCKKLTATKKDLKHYSNAARGYYKGVKNISEGTFELHYFKDLMPGYFWVFPLPDGHANVGWGMTSEHINNRKINIRKMLPEIIASNPSLQERFSEAELTGKIQGFGLPLGSRKIPISGNNFMLCGDAASLIDPLSGEGIGQAIISGRYAGWQAKKCFDENDFSAKKMQDYDKAVYQKFWKLHKAHHFTQMAINNRPWVMNMIVGLAAHNKLFYKLVQKLI